MADEIAQVCQLEVEGVKFVFNGTLTVAQLLMRMIKELLKDGWQVSKWGIEKIGDARLNHAGEHTKLKDIFKMSEGAPATMEIREEVMTEVLKQAEKKGLHFARLIDFKPGDGISYIMVPAQEAPAFATIIKALTQEQLIKDKAAVAEHNKNIDETDEKLSNAKEKVATGLTPEQRAGLEKQMAEIDKMNVKLENFKQARDEAAKWVEYDEKVLNSENLAMTLEDYLKLAEGTEFAVNPERAMAELEKGVEIGPQYSLKEALQPVRDKGSIPATNFSFYMPDIGAIISREFKVDAETGLVYSNYALKTDKGEVFQFTDRDKTAQQWNEKSLPEMLDKAGALEGTKCRVFDTMENATAYKKYHNNVVPESEKRIIEKVEAGQPVFSSAAEQREVEHAVSELEKHRNAAEINSGNIRFEIEPESLTRHNGKLVLHLGNNETLMFSNCMNEGFENGKCVFEIGKNDEVQHVKHDLQDITRTQVMSVTAAESKQFVDKMAAAKENAPVQTAPRHNAGGR